MKCPYCAEEIQDAAILCRFCGAEKRADQWYPLARPLLPRSRPKGSLTIQTAGVFFLLSSAYSLISLSSEIPLFGALRGGAVAIGYNLAYAALFAAMGVGLTWRKPWGYDATLIGTIIYSIDKLLFLTNRHTREAYLAASGVTSEVAAYIDISLLDQIVVLMSVTVLACWWGFAIYLRFRRSCLQLPPNSETST